MKCFILPPATEMVGEIQYQVTIELSGSIPKDFDNKITIFQDGRALIKAKDENEAKSMYSKFVGN